MHDSSLVERLVATEYKLYHNPQTTRAVRFGWWTHDPRFPDRHDANQLFAVVCDEGSDEELLEEVEALYAPTALPFRKLTIDDVITAGHLTHRLAERGWSLKRNFVMTHERPPQRPANPDVEIRAVAYDHPDRARVRIEADETDASHRYHVAHDDRLGGEAHVAYLDGKPVGKAGFYIHDHIARFRGIDTVPAARKRGVASTMVRHVQDHPAVRDAQCLCIHCAEDGPVRLYQQLGFDIRGEYWSALLEVK